MYVLPILLVFLVARRGFVGGMSTSGLKQPTERASWRPALLP